MLSDDQLRAKLRKIEALYAGARTSGAKSAGGAASDRISLKFENASKDERAEEFKLPIPGPWALQLFIALCRRYGIKPLRYPGCTPHEATKDAEEINEPRKLQ
jgi:hypothetical protein